MPLNSTVGSDDAIAGRVFFHTNELLEADAVSLSEYL